jgi:hypothetical protein
MELGRLVGNRVLRAGTFLLTGSLVLSACTGGGKGEDKGIGRGGSHADRAPASASAISPNKPILVFDSLGGGSSVIKVYPGVTESTRDTEHNGTYYDGNKVFAECKVTEGGRMMHSDTSPSVHEKDRSSDDWIRIQGTPGEIQYATAVYAENPDQLLAQLPEC